ncbi:uncharacterized protein LOC116852291 [Odontomachus brunneus]|uniref:uncharacterized protein LOC116852291 n=1 Tax=Odontomachus brunneus TaxID=486640 RepID=UPI0013F21768|nr:uncharacterized protein LOC116852291 [Odontomachus brunneus]XP_032688382.1 uncharacterized protein LOC116852291 [Odontomachus brunneus]
MFNARQDTWAKWKKIQRPAPDHIDEIPNNEKVTSKLDTLNELKHRVSLLTTENNSLHSENMILQKYKELLESFPEVVRNINVIKRDIKYIKTEINALKKGETEVDIITSKTTCKPIEESHVPIKVRQKQNDINTLTCDESQMMIEVGNASSDIFVSKSFEENTDKTTQLQLPSLIFLKRHPKNSSCFPLESLNATIPMQLALRATCCR